MGRSSGSSGILHLLSDHQQYRVGTLHVCQHLEHLLRCLVGCAKQKAPLLIPLEPIMAKLQMAEVR